LLRPPPCRGAPAAVPKRPEATRAVARVAAAAAARAFSVFPPRPWPEEFSPVWPVSWKRVRRGILDAAPACSSRAVPSEPEEFVPEEEHCPTREHFPPSLPPVVPAARAAGRRQGGRESGVPSAALATSCPQPVRLEPPAAYPRRVSTSQPFPPATLAPRVRWAPSRRPIPTADRCSACLLSRPGCVRRNPPTRANGPAP